MRNDAGEVGKDQTRQDLRSHRFAQIEKEGENNKGIQKEGKEWYDQASFFVSVNFY